jgi:hypothetical protein
VQGSLTYPTAQDGFHPERLRSETFSLFIPSSAVPLGNHLEPEPNHAEQAQTVNSLPALGSVFVRLRPLFLPPPFSPSHPLFAYISSVAENKSQSTRTAAEKHIADMIKAKVAEVEQFENQLRNEMDMLWRCSKVTMDEQRKNDNASPSPSRHRENNAPGSRHDPVTIQNFVRPPDVVLRPTPANSAPRISYLSASLANTGFYYPGATTEYSSSSPSHPSSPDSSPRSLSTPSSLSELSSVRARSNGGSSLLNDPFRRDMDQAKDVAASFKYFTLEHEMQKPRPALVTPEPPKVEDTAPPEEMVITNGIEKSSDVSQPPSPETISHPKSTSNHLSNGTGKEDGKMDTSAASDQQGSIKGKRKVTFNVEPSIVTIARDVDGEKDQVQELVESSGGNVYRSTKLKCEAHFVAYRNSLRLGGRRKFILILITSSHRAIFDIR